MLRKRSLFCLRGCWALFALIWIALGLVACADRTGGQPNFYLPPTAAAPAPLQPTATQPAPAVIPTLPLPTPACRDGLTFLGDLNVPDGTITFPGQVVDKRWLVENSGACNWNAGYRFKLVEGSAMGVPSEQAVYPARSGMRSEIRMLFTAPSEPGLYRSAWQAYNPQGQPFGDPFFIEIIVEP